MCKNLKLLFDSLVSCDWETQQEHQAKCVEIMSLTAGLAGQCGSFDLPGTKWDNKTKSRYKPAKEGFNRSLP